MLLTFSEQEIQENKQKIFPLDEHYHVKNIIIQNSGIKTVAELSINIKENINNLKIFNNNFSKKFLKLRIFEILDERMLEDLKKIKINQIFEVFRKYNVSYTDINPSYDFFGDKKNILDHEEEEEHITLNYKKKLNFSRENINFISLGMFFFIDKNEYLKEKKLKSLNVADDFYFTKLKIYPIVSENSVSFEDARVQDLRVIKKIFHENDFLKELKESLNSSLKHVEQSHSSKLLLNENQYFSNIYFSKDTYGNLNFMFSMDYNSLIKNNSKYKKILNNTAFPDDIRQKTHISSFKIIKKRLRKNEKSKNYFELDTDPIEHVITTSTNLNNKRLYSTNNSFSSFEEITLENNFRSFHGSDKVVLSKRNGTERNIFYKYGIRLTILDGFTEYLKNLKKKLNNNFIFLKWYYNDTQNFVKLTNKSVIDIKKGYYNTFTNNFNLFFIKNIFPLKHQRNLNKVLTDMFGILDVFGFFNENYRYNHNISLTYSLLQTSKRLDKETLLSSLANLLNPNFASSETISYFIKIYEKLLLYFERMIEDNINSKYEVEYWFKNDFVDTSSATDAGYDFFNCVKQPGFNIIGERFLREKINRINSVYNTGYYFDNIFSLTPTLVRVNNFDFSLLENSRRYINFDFSRLEIDIKRYNYGFVTNEKYDLQKYSKYKTQNEVQFIENSKNLLLKNSVFIEDEENLIMSTNKRIAHTVKKRVKEETDPSLLLLQLSKFLDSEKKLFVKNIEKRNINVNIGDRPEDAVNSTNLPAQLRSTFNNNSTFLKTNSKDAEEHSKYLFYTNTIHNLEICILDSRSIKKENWLPLSNSTLLNLKPNVLFLCRLKPYENASLGINNFKDIKLPIFDKYFFIRRIQNNFSKFSLNFNTYLPTVKKIIPVKRPFIYHYNMSNHQKFIFNRHYNTHHVFKVPNIKNVVPSINYHSFINKHDIDIATNFRPNRDFAPITHFNMPVYTKFTAPVIKPQKITTVPYFNNFSNKSFNKPAPLKNFSGFNARTKFNF